MNQETIVHAMQCLATSKGWFAVSLRAVCEKLRISPFELTRASGGAPFRDLVNRAAANCPGRPTDLPARRNQKAPTREVRREALLQVALELALRMGAANVRAVHIAAKSGASESLVKYHLYPLARLRETFVSVATANDDARLLSTLLTCAESRAAPQALRTAAAEVLAHG